MAVRTKFYHFSTSGGFKDEIESKSGLPYESALTSTNNGCYYAICFIDSTKQIYTHGVMYDCSGYDDSEIQNKIEELSDSITAELNQKIGREEFESLVDEVEENELVVAKALTDLNNSKANVSDIPTDYVSDDEFDSLVATVESKLDANDLVTINGQSLIGVGNITAGGRVDLEEPSGDFVSDDLPTTNALLKTAQTLTESELNQVHINLGLNWQYF